MSCSEAASAIPPDQMSRALARVHDRLRRRRRRVRSAGAAGLLCIVALGVGVAGQSAPSDLGQPPDFAGPASVRPDDGDPGSAPDGSCGGAPVRSELLGLDLAIKEPINWDDAPASFAAQAVVVARNQSERSLVISFPASIAAVKRSGAISAEPSAPVLLPTTVVLKPSESIELPAGLPQRDCRKRVLDGTTQLLAPLVRIDGPSPTVVQGAALVVSGP